MGQLLGNLKSYQNGLSSLITLAAIWPFSCLSSVVDLGSGPWGHFLNKKKILSIETDLSSLITLATAVFSLLKVTSGLNFFSETGPWT